MELKDVTIKRNSLIDFPPEMNAYRRQSVEEGIDAAIPFLLRSFYGARTLCPTIPGLFFDLPREKHQLATEDYKMQVNAHLNELALAILKNHAPRVNVDYDATYNSMIYTVTFSGNREIVVENGDDIYKKRVYINGKKFYE